jgi:hypothetical protein
LGALGFNAAGAPADTAFMREAGKKQLIVGLVMAGIGLAISLGSYAAASSSSGGGPYFLMWGLVIFGLIRAFRGFSMMKAAGSSPSVATPPPAAAPPPPAMPPKPLADTAPAQTIEAMTPEAASPASPPAPPAPPSSMWD